MLGFAEVVDCGRMICLFQSGEHETEVLPLALSAKTMRGPLSVACYRYNFFVVRSTVIMKSV